MATVSIIVPTFNDQRYVSDALKSIFSQSYTDYEIIVVDGGSTDGTLEVLKQQEGKITFFRQQGKGVSQAKNEAIGRSKGEYITFLDADDLWYPDKLKIQVDFLNAHPEYGFCSSDVDFFNKKGIMVKGAISQEKKPRSGNVFDELLSNNFISSATIFLRRECFDKAGVFNEKNFYAEDTDMWLRIAKYFQLGYIPRVLSKYRVHALARTQQFDKHYASLERIYGKLIKDDPKYFSKRKSLIGKAYYNLYRRWAYRYFEAKDYKSARQIYLKALKYQPFSFICWKYTLATFLPEKIIHKLRVVKAKTRSEK